MDHIAICKSRLNSSHNNVGRKYAIEKQWPLDFSHFTCSMSVNIEKSSLLSRPLSHSTTLSTRYRRFGGEFHINQCILSNQASLNALLGDFPSSLLLNIAHIV